MKEYELPHEERKQEMIETAKQLATEQGLKQITTQAMWRFIHAALKTQFF